MDYATAELVAIGLLGISAQWLAWRTSQPAILYLLIIGIIAGPVTGWLDPDAVFGDLLFPVISLAVAVILFEGGLTLRLDEIRGITGPVQRLLTVGVVVTWATSAVFAHYLVGLDWELATLFGAVMIVTGPTVIGPLLRIVRPQDRIGSILRWEGIVIDPIGALVAVLVFEFLVSSGSARDVGGALLTFGAVLAVGAGIGIAAGWLLGVALRRYWLPEFLHNVATLVAVLAAFFAANQVFHESGLLAVTVMGMWLANMRNVPLEDILDFKESLSLMLISALFILLAARLEPDRLLALGWGALALLLAMQFIGRPLTVLASTLGSTLNWRERALLAWVAPRGIVAAAVSAVFALRLAEAGYANADALVSLAFLVIIFTVIVQSATARPLAELLGVRAPPPSGVLIVGADRVGRAVGLALQQQGVTVKLADPDWDNVNQARMLGLPVYYGNPTSEHADTHLDLTGIGKLFGLSPRADLNTLACLHFAREFGKNQVFRLPLSEGDSRLTTEIRQRHRYDNTLFGEDVTYRRLATLLAEGGDIRATRLTDRFGLAEYRDHQPGAMLLLALDARGRLRVSDGHEPLEPGSGWTLIALVPAPAEAALQGASA
jgi:CPA1 family monovalent cation:H+ antiporter